MEKHLTAVAALHIGWSILGLMLVALMAILLAGLGMVVYDPQAMFIIWTILPAMGIIIGIFSLLGIIGGIGIFARKGWARILVLIISAINIVNFPLGTALGVYSIWVLVQPDINQLFAANQ